MGLLKRKRKQIPARVSQITTEWLTSVMREYGTIDTSTRVVSFIPEAVGSGGTAMTGELARLSLNYDPAGSGPATAIAKFATSDPAVKGLLELYDAYAREIHFYRDLAHQAAVRIPRHLGSAFDPGRSKDSARQAKLADALPARVQLALASDISRFTKATDRRYALVMEDIDGVVFDAVNPPSVELIAEGLRALAALHAGFWGQDKALSRHPALGHVFTRTPRLFANELRLRTFELAKQRWSQWWQPSHTVIVLTSAARLIRDVDLLNEPITVVHGDPRSDNLIYPEPFDAPPAIVDWSLSSMAHPSWDVSYLLGSSLRTGEAGAARGLIDVYCETLAELGVDFSDHELRTGVRAGWRVQAVQNVLSVRALPEGGYGEAGSLYDLWMPRVLALLATTDRAA